MIFGEIDSAINLIEKARKYFGKTKKPPESELVSARRKRLRPRHSLCIILRSQMPGYNRYRCSPMRPRMLGTFWRRDRRLTHSALASLAIRSVASGRCLQVACLTSSRLPLGRIPALFSTTAVRVSITGNLGTSDIILSPGDRVA